MKELGFVCEICSDCKRVVCPDNAGICFAHEMCDGLIECEECKKACACKKIIERG